MIFFLSLFLICLGISLPYFYLQYCTLYFLHHMCRKGHNWFSEVLLKRLLKTKGQNGV